MTMAVMVLSFLSNGLLFAAMVIALGWPIARRLLLQPDERLCATVLLALCSIFLFAWLVYIFRLPTKLFWLLPLTAMTILIVEYHSIRDFLRDAQIRRLMISQALISAWSVAFLSLVKDYSGGRLVGDWFGHWQRSLFFLYRWPQDILFNGFDALPSRPPLANVVNGAFLRLTSIDFAHYQFFSTLFSSLAFLPAAIIAQRFNQQDRWLNRKMARRPTALLVVLFMVCPLFTQNVTYAWTKLPTTFFVLTALYFFQRATDCDRPPVSAVLCAVAIAAATLTHYSAAPYLLLLALGWFYIGWNRVSDKRWQNSTFKAVAVGSSVMLVWFGWAAIVYHWGIVTSTTTVTDKAPKFSEQLVSVLLNLRDTFVPHFLGGADLRAFVQASPWGLWRDWFFQIYQYNIVFAFGSVAWIALLHLAWKQWRTDPRSRHNQYWLAFVPSIIFLGVAVHGARETGGLADICLQPLILFGLSLLAGQWDSLDVGWRRLLIAGATLDSAAGVALQFGVENHAFDRWFGSYNRDRDFFSTYSSVAQINMRIKEDAGWIFFGDVFASYSSFVLVLIGALLLFALIRVGRAHPDALLWEVDRNALSQRRRNE